MKAENAQRTLKMRLLGSIPRNQTTLLLDKKDTSTTNVGTQIKLVLHNKEHPIFDLSFEQLLFILRTKTALGDTGHVWGNELNADVAIRHFDKAGKKNEKEFDCKYLLPTEPAGKSDVVNLGDYQAWLAEEDRSDQEKRRFLQNKMIYNSGNKFQGGRQIRYWSCFVPSRHVWERLSTNIKLPGSSSSSQIDPEEKSEPAVCFSGGLFTSTKGMPTGISVELKPRGSAGYVPNFFILIEDPSLSFDIGRKSIQGRQQAMLREIAYDSFRTYINSVRKYMSGSIDEDPATWERDEIFDEIENLPDLNSGKSKFVKRPNSQEATVAAIFFELIGNGTITHIRPLISGYKGRYDLYAKWNKRKLVIEFKYDLDQRFHETHQLRVTEASRCRRKIASGDMIRIKEALN